MGLMTNEIISCNACPLMLDNDVPRPLLIGTSVVSLQDEILVMGGGAVCFSFGTYWNKGCYNLMNANPNPEDPLTTLYHKQLKPWRLLENIAKVPVIQAERIASNYGLKVPRIKITDAQDFERVMRASKAVIIEGLNLGPCTSLWTPEYLKDSIGPDRPVSSSKVTIGSIAS